jgi:hypothetical protein
MKNKPLNIKKLIEAIKIISIDFDAGSYDTERKITLSMNDSKIYEISVSFITTSSQNINIDENLESKMRSFLYNYFGKREIATEQFCMNIKERKKIVLLTIEKKKSYMTLFFKTDETIIKDKKQNEEERVFNVIKRAGDSGISLSSITVKTKRINKVVRRNIIKVLIHENKIEEIIDRSNGRMKRIYRKL